MVESVSKKKNRRSKSSGNKGKRAAASQEVPEETK